MPTDSPLSLPPLQQALLDSATVERLFADLSACAEISAVIPRHRTRTMVAENSISLAEAHRGLRAGTMHGVQIRYRFDNREWNDTLFPAPDGGVRLVRICVEDVIAHAPV